MLYKVRPDRDPFLFTSSHHTSHILLPPVTALQYKAMMTDRIASVVLQKMITKFWRALATLLLVHKVLMGRVLLLGGTYVEFLGLD